MAPELKNDLEESTNTDMQEWRYLLELEYGSCAVVPG